MKGKVFLKRVLFWVVFLTVSFKGGQFLWKAYDPLRRVPFFVKYWTSYNLRLLGHPNAKVASKAWNEIYNLYFCKWSVYHRVMSGVGDGRMISFLIERESFPVPGKPAFKGFLGSTKPVFYRAETVYCRTAGEALLAIVYNEKKWKTEFSGNWNEWWEANKECYQT